MHASGRSAESPDNRSFLQQTDNFPFVSVIIPIPPHMEHPGILNSIRKLDYPQEKLEILLSSGCLPSRQRNLAAREASGDFLVFWDDDVIVPPGYLHEMLQFYRSSSCSGAGGPCLPHPNHSRTQQTIAYILSSWWGLGPLSARYKKSRTRHNATDKDLILCNCSIQRDVFLSSGGFNEHLFPNEENELIDRLRAGGITFGYTPSLATQRPVEPTLQAHWKKMFGYGQGRAKQLKLNFSVRNLEHLTVMFLPWLTLALFPLQRPFATGFVYAYLLWLLCAVASAWRRFGSLPTAFLAGWGIFGTHAAYCGGFWYGLVHKISDKKSAARDNGVTVRKINF